MDEYAREMMDLKTLVTRTLEKRGVLARIRAELRANIFAAIEEEDRSMENEENPTFALLGTCSQRAKDLHASPTGKVLTALVCDYLEWCQLEHTLKVYLPECNLPRGFWKSELKDKFGEKADDTGSSKDNELPLLASIVESYLKHEQQNAVSNLTGSFTKLGVRRMQNDNVTTSTPTDDAQNDAEKVNPARRPSSASVGGSLSVGRKGGLAPIGQTRSSAISSRNLEVSSANDRLGGEEPVGKCSYLYQILYLTNTLCSLLPELNNI
ncbi:hypothetical protein KP509_19G002800 [Ceratopteris richardii]|uniref:LisH domain-containing protein n=1 Tax=Ceratopteris richardii TaxID=49495 RepID=A0A8T2SJM0_CERRI|nr:hypothetical protein KP509_19G002800 [Ceratopteris richardii]